jgi:DNA-binding response OmpR family regulator
MAGTRVLIVDDDRHIARLYAKILAHAGFITQTVRTVEEGIAAVATFQPQVLCLDWYIGRLTGATVLEHIQTTIPTEVVPRVIVISGKFEGVDITPYGSLVQEVMLKPVTGRDLAAAVQRIYIPAAEDNSNS